MFAGRKKAWQDVGLVAENKTGFSLRRTDQRGVKSDPDQGAPRPAIC